MSGKLNLLIGIGVGYVLGTRAGRERYEQLKAKAQTVWQDPRTQEKVHQARDVAAEKAGEAAQSLKETAQEKIRHSGSEG
ncbi:YtxH domain-containing protein [Nocardioides nematodiphilus]|uniref:YtxH domain-containing protein n=1 Tax=Nocardioides nematodiphilus TaxID=2849669 RepID=UPI001CD94C80|nr:YtxH domain-containing protein [Nocardioides nematodiphilus]MCA1982271.1 hypothetical protein [Nocardioides nematodiphilus]